MNDYFAWVWRVCVLGAIAVGGLLLLGAAGVDLPGEAGGLLGMGLGVVCIFGAFAWAGASDADGWAGHLKDDPSFRQVYADARERGFITSTSAQQNPLYLNARTGAWVTRHEYLRLLAQYRSEAKTLRYRVRRVWRRVRLGCWEADAAHYDRMITFLGGQA